MSEVPTDALMLTFNILRPKAEARKGQLQVDYLDLFSDIQSLTIKRLVQHCSAYSNDIDLQNFALGLLTFKLAQESPLPNNYGLDVYPWVEYFIGVNKIYIEAIMNSYNLALIQEISEATQQTLKNWGEVVKELEKLGGNVDDAKCWLQFRYNSECSSILSSISENACKANISWMAEFLLDSQEVGVEINTTKDMCINAICEFIIEENDLKGIRKLEGEQVNGDVDMARDVLFKVKLLNGIESEEMEIIRFIESKIGEVQPKSRKKIIKVNPNFEGFIPIEGKDLSTVIYERCDLCSRQQAGFHISIRKGKFPDGSQTVVKTYSRINPNADFSSIEDEIKILTILSNRATSDNCFIKFYGSTNIDSVLSLHMEAFDFNLMDWLTNWKLQNYTPNPDLIEKWIVSLVTAFSDLGNLKIYHGDIKPHNIIVTDRWKLKIIDFGVSKILKEIEATLTPTRAYPIQGTKGYMSPELEEMLENRQLLGRYKLGKSDVFSLGLTILQIITLEDLTSMNMRANNSRLLIKVEGINASMWIKNMLTGMLAIDRKYRLSFNKCMRYLPTIATNIV